MLKIICYNNYISPKGGNTHASEKSDIDLHIEKGKIRSLFALTGFRLALEDALRLPVDLVTSDISDKNFLRLIADEEVLLYRKS